MKDQLERLLKSYIPMSEPSFLLLSSLVEPRHGYGIMQSITETTSGRVNLGAGTVYTILYKMEQDGLITVFSEQERRKIYKITNTGVRILDAECERLIEIANLATCTKRSIDNKTIVV